MPEQPAAVTDCQTHKIKAASDLFRPQNIRVTFSPSTMHAISDAVFHVSSRLHQLACTHRIFRMQIAQRQSLNWLMAKQAIAAPTSASSAKCAYN